MNLRVAVATGLAGLIGLIGLAVTPSGVGAQIVLPAPPPPTIESEIEISDDVLGALVGGAWGHLGLRGVSMHELRRAFGSSLFLAGEFETVHEVRISVEWARPMDRISQTSAAIDGIALDLTWRMLDREIIVLGGPRFGWYRMKRDVWGPDARSSPALGGALAVVLPRWDSLEVEMRLGLTGFTLEQPGTPASRRDQPAWIQATHIGLRYRIR